MAILKSTTVTGNLSATGDILASKIIKLGGTANDLLLADGNVITKTQLQADITSNTWRPIKYGTTELKDSSTTLEFVAGTGISLAFSGGALTITGNAAYSLPAATRGALGGIKIGYNATGANLPVALSSEQAYVMLTKDAITTALDYTPIKSLSMRASGNTALKFYYTIDGGTEKAITLKSPTIPTKTSDLTNDSGFATEEWVTEQLGGSTGSSGYLKLDGSTEMTGPIKFADRGNAAGKGNNYISAGGGYSKTSGLHGLKILALEQPNAYMGMGVDLCNSGYELVVSTGRNDDTTASRLTFATNSAIRNGVAVTKDTVVYKELGGFTASGKETPDVTFNVNGTITGSNLGSSASVFDSAHVKEINLHKHSGGGRISFYGDSDYTTWYEYMNNTGTTDVPGGGTSLAYGEVTSWSRRSLLESNSGLGYGWVWESRPGATSTANPTPLMSLGARHGNLRVRGSITFCEKATWQYNSSTDCVELVW